MLKAAIEHAIDLGRSWMIGDSESDIEAGQRVGCKAILVGNPCETSTSLTTFKPDLTVGTLMEAADRLCAMEED